MKDPQFILHIHARFLHRHSGLPLHGKSFTVRLYDRDVISDDFLGAGTPDAAGTVHFTVQPSDFRKEDSFFERYPDLYMVVMENDQVIYHSPVAKNTDYRKEGNFSMQGGESIDLGEFLI